METTEKYEFDSRRKILRRTIHETGEVKSPDKDVIGTYRTHNEQEYKEDGVKHLIKELKKQREQIEKALSQLNKDEELASKAPVFEGINGYDDFLKVQETCKIYAKIKGNKEQKAYFMEQLGVVNKQLNEIINAVGKHMKI